MKVNFCQYNLVIRKKQLYLMNRGLQISAPNIVLLVFLIARFLQKLHAKFDSISDSNTESHIDHGKEQSSEKSIVNIVPSEPAKTSHSPFEVRRSTRSTKGIPPKRYGSVTPNKVNVSSILGKWMNSIF